ncbi:hypothetical protein GE21DRAFT_1083914 [Neurospora crassa]|nr:hypothetical protein GE21DRAFT_1083914 [Neurospora crassa]
MRAEYWTQVIIIMIISFSEKRYAWRESPVHGLTCQSQTHLFSFLFLFFSISTGGYHMICSHVLYWCGAEVCILALR